MKLVTLLFVLTALAVVPVFADGNFLVRYINTTPVGTTSGGINFTNSGASWGQNLAMAGGTAPAGPALAPGATTLLSNGYICANVYVFSPDEQLQECCSCAVSPNALYHFSITDLTGNPNSPGHLGAGATIKMVASAACTYNTTTTSPTFGQCVPANSQATAVAACQQFVPANAAAGLNAPLPPAGPMFAAAFVGQTDRGIINGGNVIGQPLVGGLAAWAFTLHGNGSTSPLTYDTTETPFDTATLSARELNRLTTLCYFNITNGSGVGVCPSVCPTGSI